jgi:uncharacterized protein YdhG (YjbR/CyaY superfamily)
MTQPVSGVDRYITAAPAEFRSALTELRATIARAAPAATEAISYQMPSFKYKGRVLVYYAAFKKHCSFFPASMAVIETFADVLAPFRTAKGTLSFTPDEPLPKSLVRKMVKAKMKEIDAKGR